MADYRMIVLTRPVEGREDEYNKWYSDIHLPEVLMTEGFVAAQRFKLVDGQDGPAPYLAIYEVVSDDFPTSFAKLIKRVEDGEVMMSSALDTSAASASGYEPITQRITG